MFRPRSIAFLFCVAMSVIPAAAQNPPAAAPPARHRPAESVVRFKVAEHEAAAVAEHHRGASGASSGTGARS